MLNRVFILGVFLLGTACFSQEADPKLSKGNKLSDEYAYFKAIDVYEKVANQGYKSVELFKKLGDAYFFNGEYTKAYQWYNELFKINDIVDPIYYYRFSQTLKSVGELEKSEEYLKEFSKVNKTDSRSVQYKENKNYLQEIEDNSNRYTINDAGINSPFSDYGPALYKDKVVFTSSRMPEGGKGTKEERDNWTYDYYSSLYVASLSKKGVLSDVKVFGKEIQTKFHESIPFFSKDGSTMYFTKTNDTKKNKSKKTFLKIYKATLVSGKWGYVTELPFNSDEFSCAHPILSPDEKFMYFVSNMPGGYGDSDLYKVAITGPDSYGTAVNLGKNINTQGKETFPVISNDELYFASDGHLGLGGLDIFATNIQFDKYNSKVVNLGKPVNSEFDDFSFVRIEEDLKLGFFTSNRAGGKGKDDIYSFVETIPLALTTKIGGQVVDGSTLDPISNVVIAIYDENHKLIANTVTDLSGMSPSVTDNNPKGGIYYVQAEATGYESQEFILDSKTADLEKGFVLGMAKIRKTVEVGDDLAKTLAIKGVLFDLDKYNIRADTEVELQKIVQVMKDYPEIEIEIRAHTDSRHTNAYNKKLSKRRANASKDYLIANGISKKRIDIKALGETQLLNHCANEVYCSEAEHELNRRCEFIVEKS